MSARLLLAATAMLATALPHDAIAQDAEPAPELRVRLAPGESVRLRQRIVSDGAIDPGSRPMLMGAETVTDVTITGLPPADDGRPRVTWRFDRFWGSIESPMMSGDFDSARAELAVPMMEVIGAIGGCSFTLTLSPLGAVEEVEGIEAALAAAKARFEGGGPIIEASLARTISADAVREQVAWFLLPTPYPSEGIAWSDADVIPGTSTMQFQIATERSIGAVTATDVTLDGTSLVTIAPGRRKSRLAQVFEDDTPDSLAFRSTCRISRKDGLPIRHEADLDVVAPVPGPKGNGAFAQRSRIVVERLAPDAGTDVLPGFRIERPATDSPLRLLGSRTRAMALLVAGHGDKAEASLTEAIELAAALSRQEPESLERARDWFGLAMALATAKRREKAAGKTAAALRIALEATDAREQAGDPEAVSERLGVLLMLADVATEQSDPTAADDALAQAEAVGRRLAQAAPDDAGVAKRLGAVLRAKSAAISARGDYVEALAVGEEAHTLGDRASAGVGRAAPAQEALSRLSWDLAHLAFRLDKWNQGRQLLERAQSEATDAIGGTLTSARLLERIALRLSAVTLMADGRKPADALQALEMAYLLMELDRDAPALRYFETALADDAVRADFARFNAYNGACVAARLHAGAQGEEKARLEALAIGWLAPYAAHVRNRLEAVGDDAERARIEQEIRWFRTEDADLASLRALPAFEALFTD